MEKMPINVLLTLCLVVLFFLMSFQWATAAGPDTSSRFAIELINQIRLDPVGYAEDIGYKREMILKERPWLAVLLETKLPVLEVSADLNARAAELNSPVLGNDVLEQKPFLANDYARTGGFGGVVASCDFMDAETAIRVVVDNQFKSELDADFQGQRCLLNSELNLVGVAVEEGIGIAGKVSENACYITVTLGSFLLKSRRQVLNLINQVRANPSGAAAYQSFNLAFNLDVFPMELAPVFFGEGGQAFSENGSADLDNHDVHKSSVIEVFPKADVNTKIFWIFSSLVLNEIKGGVEADAIFSENVNEAWIDLMLVNGITSDHARLTLITGSEENEKQGYSKLYGLVYADENVDGVYTPGEGMGAYGISIYDPETRARVWTTVTDNTGHFSAILLTNKTYIVQAGYQQILAEKEIFLEKDNFCILEAGIE